MDIFGAMLAIAAHRQINVQNTAAQMWFGGSFLSTYLMSCFGSPLHQIDFNVLRTVYRIYLPMVEM